MDLRQVAKLLARFTGFFTLSALLPLVVAEVDAEPVETVRAFGVLVVVGGALAVCLWWLGRPARGVLFRREGLTVVGIAWVVAGLLAALPMHLSGAIPGYLDAVFESVSGLTTTGASVLGGDNPAIESLPRAVLLWRSMLQWIGGIGIVLTFVVLLPGMGVAGSKLLSSEQVGLSSGGVRPRMRQQAQRLFLLYIALTASASLCYWFAGMPLFDGLCHALTTLSSGGFSTKTASVGGYLSVGVELVSIVFMFLAGCNFILLMRVAAGRATLQNNANIIQLIEFRVYLSLVVGIAVAIAVILWAWGRELPGPTPGEVHDYSDFGRCLRDAAFQTVSLLTTTGYCTADFQRWPSPALYLLMLCMFIGGCTSSTAGGFKVLRVVICGQLIGYAIRLFIRPARVQKLRIGVDVIPNSVVSATLAMLLLWISAVAAGTLVLTLDPRLDLVAAFSASLSMMGCVGPAICEVMTAADGSVALVGQLDLGPYGSFGELRPVAKVVMVVQMILGRLEILAPLVLLTPAFWRR